jgi:hypothetical protein
MSAVSSVHKTSRTPPLRIGQSISSILPIWTFAAGVRERSDEAARFGPPNASKPQSAWRRILCVPTGKVWKEECHAQAYPFGDCCCGDRVPGLAARRGAGRHHRHSHRLTREDATTAACSELGRRWRPKPMLIPSAHVSGPWREALCCQSPADDAVRSHSYELRLEVGKPGIDRLAAQEVRLGVAANLDRVSTLS